MICVSNSFSGFIIGHLKATWSSSVLDFIIRAMEMADQNLFVSEIQRYQFVIGTKPILEKDWTSALGDLFGLDPDWSEQEAGHDLVAEPKRRPTASQGHLRRAAAKAVKRPAGKQSAMKRPSKAK